MRPRRGRREGVGVSDGHADRPDPEDDPFACSRCGCFLGSLDRARGEDYCPDCRSENAAAVETLPLCSHCDAFAVPDDEGRCGRCGSKVFFAEGPR